MQPSQTGGILGTGVKTMYHILVVDDEERIRKIVRKYAEFEGYQVTEAGNGMEAVEICKHEQFDILILDVMMPKMNGCQVAREVRVKRCGTPILMLTARSELADKVTGLDSGADYYLTKPFEPRELTACVRALSRRTPELREDESLTCGDLRLELTALTLWRGEENVRLSRKECDLLELLIRNRKLVLSKESILVKIWGYESEAEDNNVEVYISFLRRKLARLHSTVKIRTIRMAGYCLEEA